MTTYIDMHVPDLGAIEEARVIEWLVKKGDNIKLEQSVLTVESEKAALEIPATVAGIVQSLTVKVGDRVSTSTPILSLQVAAEIENTEQTTASNVLDVGKSSDKASAKTVHASPEVRRLAREQGVDLSQVIPTGQNKRIIKEDVEQARDAWSSQPLMMNQAVLSAPEMPDIDFGAFGETTIQSLSRTKKISASVLQRNWLMAPHVTQFDEVDITELDCFRKHHQMVLNEQSRDEGNSTKLTLLPFVMKSIVYALKYFPQFNASLSQDGQQLILKQYYHMGVAVDTPTGLLVPVIRDVEQQGLVSLAQVLAHMSQKARAGQLSPVDSQGHSFSVSSLGNVGGGHFTPIINVPDVAILGISKAMIKPVYINNQFEPRLLLPLSLSYDHRVIDGAEAVRFMSKVVSGLRDMREWLL